MGMTRELGLLLILLLSVVALGAAANTTNQTAQALNISLNDTGVIEVEALYVNLSNLTDEEISTLLGIQKTNVTLKPNVTGAGIENVTGEVIYVEQGDIDTVYVELTDDPATTLPIDMSFSARIQSPVTHNQPVDWYQLLILTNPSSQQKRENVTFTKDDDFDWDFYDNVISMRVLDNGEFVTSTDTFYVVLDPGESKEYQLIMQTPPVRLESGCQPLSPLDVELYELLVRTGKLLPQTEPKQLCVLDITRPPFAYTQVELSPEWIASDILYGFETDTFILPSREPIFPSANVPYTFSFAQPDTPLNVSFSLLNKSYLLTFLDIEYLGDQAGNATNVTINRTVLPTNTTNLTFVDENQTYVEQELARIDAPVRWKKRIPASTTQVATELPETAFVLSVAELKGQERREVLREMITEQKREKRSAQNKPTIVPEGTPIRGPLLARSATPEFEAEIAAATELIVNTIDAEYVEVIYETPAPQVIVTNTSNTTKRVAISSDLHYVNVTSYVDIPEFSSNIGATVTWNVNDTNVTMLLDSWLSDEDGDGIMDRVNWITPHLSNQTFDVELHILNVQSYPTVGGLWIVNFTTTGLANISFTGSNGTTYGYVLPNDLVPGELYCGNTLVNYTYENGTAHVADYTCNQTSSWSVTVLTGGVHQQQITFGGAIGYANNYARYEPNFILLKDASGTPDSTSPAVVNWGHQDRIDGNYTHSTSVNSDRIQVNADGIYRVNYGLFVTMTGNNRLQIFGRVRVDGADVGSCYDSGYARNSAGQDLVMAGECLLNLSAGQNISIVTERVSTANGLGPSITANQSWLHIQQVNASQILILRDTIGNDDFSNDLTGVPIGFDTINVTSSYYNYTANDDFIEVLQSGLYKVTYSVGTDHVGVERHSAYGALQVDRGSGYENQTFGWSHANLRYDTGTDRAVVSASTILNLSANDLVRLIVGQASDFAAPAGDLETVGNEIHFDMEYLGNADSNTDVLMIYDAAGGDNINVDSITQQWDTRVLQGQSYNFTADDTNITILLPGVYHVAYGVYADRTTGGTRFDWTSTLHVNGVAQDSCYGSGYNRGAQGSEDSFTGASESSCYLDLTTGDNISVVHTRAASAQTITTVGGRVYLTIHSLSIEANPPSVTSLTVTPDPQVLSNNVTISAIITDANNIANVNASITNPEDEPLTITLTDNNADGTYEGNFTTTGVLGNYTYVISAEDQYGSINDTENSSFIIDFNTLAVSTDKPSYLRNETVYFTVTGYNNTEYINLTVYDPTLDPVPGFPVSLLTDVYGTNESNWTVPEDQQLGTYSVNITNNFSRIVSNTFKIVSATVVPNNDTYELGDTIYVAGENWDAGENVTVNLTNATAVIYSTNVTANSSGEINLSFNITYDILPGDHNITGRQPSNPNKRDTYPITIIDRDVHIDTEFSWYLVDESINITAFNFTPNATVEIDIRYPSGTSVSGYPQNFTANGSGDFSILYGTGFETIFGNYTIIGNDQNFTRFSANTTYLLTQPIITTDEVAYSSGDVITVSGSYWPRSQNVTLEPRNSSGDLQSGFPVNRTANANGAISYTYTAQPGTGLGAEEYNLTGYQASNSSRNASTLYNVTIDATVYTDRHVYGPNMTVNITGSFYDVNGDVEITVFETSTNKTELTFPVTVTSNGQGDITYSGWNTSNYCEGTYTVRAVDQNFPEQLFDEFNFTINHHDFVVQRGYVVIPVGATTASITAPEDYGSPLSLSNSFVRIVGTRITGAGHDEGDGTQPADEVMVSIANPGDLLDNVTFERYDGTSWSTRVYYEIIEYRGPSGGPFEFIVRDQAEIEYTGTTSTTGLAVLGVSDDNDIAVFITGQRPNSGGSGDADRGLHTSSWIALTDIPQFDRGDGTGQAALSYAVVEFTGSAWAVKRAEHTYVAAATTETETIAAVNATNRAFLHPQIRTASGALDEQGQRVWLSADNEVSFRLRSGAAVSQVGVAWVIEENSSQGTDMLVNRYSNTRAINLGGEPDQWNDSVTAVGNLFASSIMGETADSSGAGTAFPRGSIGLELVEDDTVALWRSDNGQNHDYRFEVVEWPNTTSVANCLNFDIINPDVNVSTPSEDDQFNLTNIVLLSVNASDNIAVDTVFANVTLPNSTVETVQLSLTSGILYEYNFTTTNSTGNYSVVFYSNDTWRNINSSETTYFVLNDVIAPTWSDNTTSITNPATYISGQLYEFNVTWNDDYILDTVIVEHNFTESFANHTFAATGNGVYNYTYSDLSVGDYVWRMYANDTSNNLNQTDQWTFSVVQATPVFNLTLNGVDANITVELGSSVALNGTILTPSYGTLSLYYNNSHQNTSNDTVTATITTVATGVYPVNVTYNATHNFTNGQLMYNISVEDTVVPAVAHVNVSPDPQTLGSEVNITTTVTDLNRIDTVVANITYPNGTVVQITLSDDDQNTTYNGTFTDTSIVGGYNVLIIATDNSSNVNQTESIEFTIDYNTLSIDTDFDDYVTTQTVYIVGGGFSASNNVTLYIYNSTGSLVSGFPANFSSNETGRVNATWTIPGPQPTGTYDINLTDVLNTSRSINRSISVIPAVVITNNSFYQPGYFVNISGLGWNQDENVTINITDSQGGQALDYTQINATGSLGGFEYGWQVAWGAPNGTYSVFAFQSIDASKNDSFEFEVHNRETLVTVDLPWYRTNQTVYINASGFRANDNVTINITNSTGDLVPSYPLNETTNATGEINTTWTILPTTLEGGNYTITVYDYNFSNIQNSTTLLLIDEIISTASLSYEDGELVTFIGNYWDRDKNVTFTISNGSGSPLAGFPINITADSDGNFSYNWSAIANNSVVVTEYMIEGYLAENQNENYTHYINVTRVINITTDKEEYDQYQILTATGRGFTSDGVTTVNIRSNATSDSPPLFPKNVSVNSTGGFMTQWLIPNYCNGTYFITGADTIIPEQVNATNNFTITILDDNASNVSASDDNVSGTQTTIFGDYSDTAASDTSYFSVGGVDVDGNFQSWINLTYDLSILGTGEDRITDFNFTIEYCHSGDQTVPVCGQGDPHEGTAIGTQDVEIWNFNTNTWESLGSLSVNGGSDAALNRTHNISGALSPYIENDLVHIRYDMNFTTTAADDVFLVINYAALNVNYGIEPGSASCGETGEIYFITQTDGNLYFVADNVTGNNPEVFGYNDTVNTIAIDNSTGEYPGLVTFNFTQNFNASEFSGGVNRTQAKSFLHNSSAISTVVNKSLLIPRVDNYDYVYFCPGATTIDAVNNTCPGAVALAVGDTYNGFPVTTVTYGSNNYYLVRNILGSGGGEDAPELFVSSLTFDNTNGIEGQNITLQVNVTNSGLNYTENFTVSVNISLYNGTETLNESQQSNYIDVESGETVTVNFSWIVKIGQYNFNVTVDNQENVTERNETNNTAQINYTTSIWHIYYGNLSDVVVGLDSAAADRFTTWSVTNISGNLLYSDSDASYNVPDLEPLDDTNDFVEADVALDVLNYSDSITALYDTDNNDVADNTTFFDIGGQNITGVPYIVTTTNETFITGVLWDSGDGGTEYNGSQDLVFITKVNQSQSGAYGVYDYEVRIPSPLERLTPGFDSITLLQNLQYE